MKKAHNKKKQLIDIIESKKNEKYYCPFCKEILIRKFGKVKQYFAHKNNGEQCELKLIQLEKNEVKITDEVEEVLIREYYNKSFNDVDVELSDYLSEEGYYLTNEQKNIIYASEDKIKVAALAGSSKSTTIYYYCKERPYKKILYLVYNKSMKDEAEKMFSKLSHVEIKTTHGLAYNYIGKFYKNKLTNSYGVVDIVKDLNLNWNDIELAAKIDRMLKEYMLSDKKCFEDVELFNDDAGNAMPEKNEIISYCKIIWKLKKDYNNNIKVEHDFYLKLFHLSSKELSSTYDIICLDEAQDSNMMMLDILSNSNVNGVVVVGDQYQQLYGWRNAKNIMPHFEGKKYYLTTSFRVSQNISNIANMIVKDVTENEINMKGFNVNQKIVSSINKNKPYVCLCRTNNYIFAEVFDVINRNKKSKLYFEGGYNSYNFQNIKDAYYFNEGHKVNNQLFNKFNNYDQMIKYAKEIEDLELLALDRMIYKYGNDIPKIIDSIKYNTVKNKNEANVIFSTIHRSKGQTYKIPVLISDDHFDIESSYKSQYLIHEKDFNIKKYYEEMCILYVAITRAANEIELSPKLKNYLLLKHLLKG